MATYYKVDSLTDALSDFGAVDVGEAGLTVNPEILTTLQNGTYSRYIDPKGSMYCKHFTSSGNSKPEHFWGRTPASFADKYSLEGYGQVTNIASKGSSPLPLPYFQSYLNTTKPFDMRFINSTLTDSAQYFILKKESNKLKYTQVAADIGLTWADRLASASWKTAPNSIGVSTIILHVTSGGGDGCAANTRPTIIAGGGGGGSGITKSFIINLDKWFSLPECEFSDYKILPIYIGEKNDLGNGQIIAISAMCKLSEDTQPTTHYLCQLVGGENGSYNKGGKAGFEFRSITSLVRLVSAVGYLFDGFSFDGSFGTDIKGNSLVSISAKSRDLSFFYSNSSKTSKEITFGRYPNRDTGISLYGGTGGPSLFSLWSNREILPNYGQGGNGGYVISGGTGKAPSKGIGAGVVIEYRGS